MKTTDFFDVMPCGLIVAEVPEESIDLIFREPFYPQCWGNVFLRNVGIGLSYYMTSYVRKQ